MLLLSAIPQEEKLLTRLERGWQDDLIQFVQHDLPHILFVLLLALIMQRVVLFFVRRMRVLADRQSGNPMRASQLRTTASILRATSYAIIGSIVLLHILSHLGFNLTPLLASAGVIGVGIGLGAQSLFKDIINGVFILVEDQYNVGDNVKAASLTGTVEDLTLRVTKLRDADGTLHFIPNSQIATVSNLSRDFSIATMNVSVEASANPDKVIATLRSIANSLRTNPAFRSFILGDPDVPGIDKISGRTAIYPINLRCQINQKDAVLRELRRCVLLTFEKEGISLGVETSMLITQRADPTAPPAQQPLVS